MQLPRENKPLWSQVPEAVKRETERSLGARVVRARRAFGGYGPSATFVLTLSEGRQAFFKGVYPLPEGSAVIWRLDEEERVYRELGPLIDPWAPAYYGSVRVEGWHVLLFESLRGARVPPWTAGLARQAMHSFADFHAHSVGTELPAWLPRHDHLQFMGYWTALESNGQLGRRLVALCSTQRARRDARNWLTRHRSVLAKAEAPLAAANRFALIHFDTRSDNIRINGELLRLFDWPFASAGPPEIDFAAFAQSVDVEGGPLPEQLTEWYSEVLPLDSDVLTASVVAVSGFFAERGSLPDIAGLPRLRPFQRRQLNSSLRWAALRLGLPEPEWLGQLVD